LLDSKISQIKTFHY